MGGISRVDRSRQLASLENDGFASHSSRSRWRLGAEQLLLEIIEVDEFGGEVAFGPENALPARVKGAAEESEHGASGRIGNDMASSDERVGESKAITDNDDTVKFGEPPNGECDAGVEADESTGGTAFL